MHPALDLIDFPCAGFLPVQVANLRTARTVYLFSSIENTLQPASNTGFSKPLAA
jgi:hypothetical protein